MFVVCIQILHKITEKQSLSFLSQMKKNDIHVSMSTLNLSLSKFRLMNLSGWDIKIIVLFFIVTLAIGLIVGKKSGTDADEFFLGGRKLPWWLLGV